MNAVTTGTTPTSMPRPRPLMVRRTISGNVMVTGDFAKHKAVLERHGFQFHAFMDKLAPAMFLARSTTRVNSMRSWDQTMALLRQVGASPQRGFDDLDQKRRGLETARSKREEAADHDCGLFDLESIQPAKSADDPEGKKKEKKLPVPVLDRNGNAVEVPDLPSYDLIAINSSGGKDSIASMAVVVKMLEEAGVLDRAVVVHADLGKVVDKGTRELVERQAAHFGLPVRFAPMPDHDLLDDMRHEQGTVPDSGKRFCTSKYKRTPMSKLFTQAIEERKEALRVRKLKSPYRILSVMGFRGEESANRDRELTLSVDVVNGAREVHQYLPIKDMTVDEVWDTIHESGVEWPESYDKGNDRHSCTFCIFGSQIDWINGLLADPVLGAEMAALEQDLGKTLKSGSSLTALGLALKVFTRKTIDNAVRTPVPADLIEKTEREGTIFPITARPEKLARFAELADARAAKEVEKAKARALREANRKTPKRGTEKSPADASFSFDF